MPKRAKPAGELEAAKKALADDRPYDAWQSAMAGAKRIEDAPRQNLALIIEALRTICDDLDEHGPANLDLYGEGKYSIKAMRLFYEKAKALDRAARHPKKTEPQRTAVGPSSAQLGKPVLLLESEDAPPPLMTSYGFVSRDPSTKRYVLRGTPQGAIEKQVGDFSAWPHCGATSADGRFVALGSIGVGFEVFAAATGARIAHLQSSADTLAIALGADGATFAAEESSEDRARLSIFSSSSGPKALVERRFSEPLYCTAMSFLSDGRLVLLCKDQLRVHDRTLATVLEERVSLQPGVLCVLDDRCAFVRPPGRVALVDLETGNLTAELKVANGGGGFARAAVNQRRTLGALLTKDKKGSAVELYRLNPLTLLARRELAQPVSSNASASGVAFAPDDSGLVVALEGVTAWVTVE